MTARAPFRITADTRAASLTATLCGLWDVATVRAYGEQLAEAAQRIARGSGRPSWLIDLRELEVQPQEVASQMTRIIADLTGRFDPVVAVVSPRVLVSMQSRRIAQRPDHQSFATHAEASAWLQHQR